MRISFSFDGFKMKGGVNERGSPSDMSRTFQKGHKGLPFSFAKNKIRYMMPNDGQTSSHSEGLLGETDLHLLRMQMWTWKVLLDKNGQLNTYGKTNLGEVFPDTEEEYFTPEEVETPAGSVVQREISLRLHGLLWPCLWCTWKPAS